MQVVGSLCAASIYVLCNQQVLSECLLSVAWAFGCSLGLLGLFPRRLLRRHPCSPSVQWCVCSGVFVAGCTLCLVCEIDLRVVTLTMGTIQALFLLRRVTGDGAGGLVGTVGLSVAVSTVCLVVVWGSGVLTPHVGANLAGGSGHVDTLMHLAGTRMLATYGVFTTGLDGIPYFPYHWGSHAILHGLVKATGVPIWAGYSLLFPVVWVPLFLRMFVECTLVCTGSMHRWQSLNPVVSLASVLFVIWPVSMLSFAGGVPSGLQYIIPWVSESLVISLVFVWVAMCVVLETIERNSSGAGFIVLAVLSALICLAALSKITSGFGLTIWLTAVSLQYAYSRQNWRPLLCSAVPGFFALLLVLVVFSGSGSASFRGLYGFAMSVSRFGFVRNLLLFTLPALLILFPLAISIRRRLIPQAIRRLKSNRGGIAAAYVLPFIFLPLPALLVTFSDDEKYFFWTPILMAGPACAASLGTLFSFLAVAPRILMNAVGLLCFCGLLTNEGLDFVSQEKRYLQVPSRADAIREEFLTALRELDLRVPPHEKRASCLFIPLPERALLLDKDSLSDLFLPVTLTGIAQLYGQPMPDSVLFGVSNFSLGVYERLDSIAVTETAARARAASLGFKTLFVVRVRGGRVVVDELSVSQQAG